MKVFISWSGEKSKNVASLIKGFLQLMIPDIPVFLSTDDIRSGEIWFRKISQELADTNYGIIVLTNENKEAPWLLFEAGALFKGLPMNRIIPLTVDLNPSEVESPLSSFQVRPIDEKNMFKIIKDIKDFIKGKSNEALSEMTAKEFEILNNSFKFAWPYFDNGYTDILLKYAGSSFDLSFMQKFIFQDNDEIGSIAEKLSPNKRSIHFTFEKDSNIRDDNFVMLGYIFDEPQDWSLFCESGYLIKFDIEMNNIRSLKFELKTLRYNIEIPIVRELNQSESHYEIEINKGLLKKIKYVKEICFTVFNTYMLEGNCEFSISNLRIEP